MTNPKTGWITREWEVETIVVNYANSVTTGAAKAAFSSIKHPVVSEAVLLGVQCVGFGTITTPANGAATVIAHDVSFPTMGTVGATQAATLAPQQFLVAGLSGTQATGQFAIRGR